MTSMTAAAAVAAGLSGGGGGGSGGGGGGSRGRAVSVCSLGFMAELCCYGRWSRCVCVCVCCAGFDWGKVRWSGGVFLRGGGSERPGVPLELRWGRLTWAGMPWQG
ncbi:hypothetical protein PLESTF_001735800 [Pleodorina starrii]|nr:hypothetical protein PLESTF_001735800 [Pleodorina starrii]